MAPTEHLVRTPGSGSPASGSEPDSPGCLILGGAAGVCQPSPLFEGEVKPWLVLTLRILNTLVFIATCVMNGLGASGIVAGSSQGDISDANPTPITPAGYAFTIWGLIYFFQALLWLVYQWTPCVNKQLVFHRIGFWHVGLGLCNMAWIVTFSYELLEVSAAIIWALLACLAIIYVRIYTHYASVTGPLAVREKRTWVEYFCVYVPFALYTSWVLGACLISIFIACQNPVEDTIYGGLAALGVAAFINIAMLAWTRDAWFAGTNVWTLIAIANNQTELPKIWGAAVSLACVVALCTLFTWVINLGELIYRHIRIRRGQRYEEKDLP
mmetsp:Transcript_27035/g.48171  ORF Transcript_27035/g.48171 Transcript_27035/m.48171 type:complete len:326 (-) Transcript_27035:233-1210(-)